MSPVLVGVGLAGGYLLYQNLKTPDANLPAGDGKQVSGQNAWPSWMHIGNQPTAGNGPASPTDNSKEVANAIAAVGNFATSLVNYFGTADQGNGMNAGQSAGAASGGAGGFSGDFDNGSFNG